MPLWRLRLLLLAAAAAASLTSCDGGGSSIAASNPADATFLRSMTDHEQPTLGITRLAQRRALRTELRGIARTMTSAQQTDLHKLGSLAHGLTSRGMRPPATGRDPRLAMVELARVKDATSFDYEFMRTMIEQNQVAIAMARQEENSGNDPQVKRLAVAIRVAREKELKRLREWLHLWYGDVQPGPPSPGPPGGGGGGGQKPRPGPPSPNGRAPVPL